MSGVWRTGALMSARTVALVLVSHWLSALTGWDRAFVLAALSAWMVTEALRWACSAAVVIHDMITPLTREAGRPS